MQPTNRPAPPTATHHLEAARVSEVATNTAAGFRDADCVDCRKQVGEIVYAWRIPSWIDSPLLLLHDQFALRRYFKTLVEIAVWYRDRLLFVVDAGFVFDGSSIPEIFWCVPGFSPLADHVWAALPHDFICEHPEIWPRILGDALFGYCLEQIRVDRERRLSPAQRTWKYRAKNVSMYLAVRGWSTWKGSTGYKRLPPATNWEGSKA